MADEEYRFRHERKIQPTLEVDDETLKSIDNDVSRISQPPDDLAQAKKPHFQKKKLLWLGVIVGIGIVGVVAFFIGRSTNQVAQNTVSMTTSTPTAKKVEVQQKLDVSDLGKFTTPTTGEKWYKEPKSLPSQAFVGASYVESVQYYEVGTRGKNTIILGDLNYGIGGSVELFEKSPDGQVRHIAQPSSTANYTTQQIDPTTEPLFVKSVAEDTSIHYDSLSIPSSVPIDNKEVVTQISYPDLGQRLATLPTDGVETKTVKTYGQSKVVRTERKYSDTGLTSIGYAIQLPIGTQVRVVYDPIPTKLTGYKWDNGTSSDETIYGIVRGCGASGSVSRADTVSADTFVSAGRSSDGQTVYGFKNDDATLVTKAYDEYVDFYKDDTTTTVVSKQEFIKQHGIFAYKSKQGEWLIYTTDTFSPAYGCAKPVVYLYPEREQQVQVRVGADVKVSDPWYNPSTGWTALARPTGKLTVNGQHFDSLFWEGPGKGEYPAITSGTIVKREQALSTIKRQLAQQGLNAKESQDFIDYWQDKIPNKPYIRLTWLTNKQLDHLAPLAITPKPDTVHRVFLDMTGLDQPIKLPAQKLETVQRKGFTVIEWGGLAQGKLY